MKFSPGTLVRARGREWVVLPEIEDDLLLLRPLGGVVYGVDTIGYGHIEALPRALTPCPELAGRPLCHLAPGTSRA